MPIDLDSFSRFKETQPIIFDGKETFGSWKMPQFLVQDIDELQIIRIMVTNGRNGRPDLIASDIYGSPQYFWVLIAYNKPKNPIGWPAVGEVIRAPIADIVLANL